MEHSGIRNDERKQFDGTYESPQLGEKHSICLGKKRFARAENLFKAKMFEGGVAV
jgi:hypothetical protein